MNQLFYRITAVKEVDIIVIGLVEGDVTVYYVKTLQKSKETLLKITHEQVLIKALRII
jgi:hypothetical protein